MLASQLVEHDLVIVPFDSLQQEVWFSPPLNFSNSSSSSNTSTSSSMSLRGVKRYRKLFSPILGVRWWRLVIDEAQLAGGNLLMLLLGSLLLLMLLASAAALAAASPCKLCEYKLGLSSVLQYLILFSPFQALYTPSRYSLGPKPKA